MSGLWIAATGVGGGRYAGGMPQTPRDPYDGWIPEPDAASDQVITSMSAPCRSLKTFSRSAITTRSDPGPVMGAVTVATYATHGRVPPQIGRHPTLPSSTAPVGDTL